MKTSSAKKGISRRLFLKLATMAGFCFSFFGYPFPRSARAASSPTNYLFWVQDIPDQPFDPLKGPNQHVGVEGLLDLMGMWGLKFYRSSQETHLSGPIGMIASHDVVLIKVNAQWKYRGCTNSDLIRGLIQKILDHPDGFDGEVVIFENGQGRGSLNCDTASGYPDGDVHANANDESHSFVYLANSIFSDPRVSCFLLDPIGGTFIGSSDHVTNGYRRYDRVSYPCFTTARGHRVELREGIWNGTGYSQNIKLINVPVLKHHDTGGSEITASLKHFYGVVSMADGQSGFRHYTGLGETSGRMVVSVRTPVLNIIDAIWVSHISLSGYPTNMSFRANQILASQDPVALDYWAAKYILFPIDGNGRHHPNFPGIDQWLTGALGTINGSGGLYSPNSGIFVQQVTKTEREMFVNARALSSSDTQKIQDLVKKYYHDILQRDPDAGGTAFWAAEIERTISLGIGKGQAFHTAARFFFNSEEYRLKNRNDQDFLTDLYQALLNRPPDAGGFHYWLDYLAQGLTRNMVIACFFCSEEFEDIIQNIFGPDATRPENNLINDLYRGLLHRFPDTIGFDSRLITMRNARCAGELSVRNALHQIALAFLLGPEYTWYNTNDSEFVEDLYDAILQRGADPGGYSYWADSLSDGTYRREQVLEFFTNSPEFQLQIQEVISAPCIQ